jgi:two-component system nitrate/nitrite response regulator NarL
MTQAGVVLVVTQDAALRSAIARRFKRMGFTTSEVATGEEALAFAQQERPSLVVLDLDLAEMSGYETLQELREQIGDRLPIIFLSGKRTDAADRVAGLLIGADDYLTKPFDMDELLARARRVLVRSPDTRGPAVRLLTARELEILQLLSGGLSQERIATDLFISAKTVGTHIQRILTKLGVHSRTEAVALAYRRGLMRAGEEEAEI